MTRRRLGAPGRYGWIVDPGERHEYRDRRGRRGRPDPLAIRAALLAELRREELVPALHPRADRQAWRRLWLALDRRNCPRRPERERQDYADRLEEADLRQRFPLTRETPR